MKRDTRRGANDAPAHPFADDPATTCAKAARGALSPNTERALRSDLAVFTAWCDAEGLPALPAGAKTLAAFVEAMARTRAPATVRRYLASIAAAHRALGADKTTADEAVRRAMQRMHRRKGRRQAQAKALNWALREQLLAATGDTLADARNRALLAVAYDTLLRRSELVCVQVSDIVGERDGSATVFVRRAKTDREGRGAQLYIAPDSVALVVEWLERSGVVQGRVFRSLARGVLGERLDAAHVARIFKKMALDADLPAEAVGHISGHSTRVGAAQDMVAGGIGMPAIMQAGRWRSEATVSRYGERLIARQSGAAQLARLQHRG